VSFETERIRAIEAAAADALPCRERVDDDGWRLRFNDGLTRRCNSVLAEAAGADALEDKIERAEAFYRARRALTRFQLTAASLPRGLEATLEARGYRVQAGASVQTAGLAALARGDGDGHTTVATVAAAPDEAWLDAHSRGSGEGEEVRALRAATLRRVPAPLAFVSLRRDGVTVAVGLGVARGAWLGVFNMATVPEARRCGAASAVLHAACVWGLAQGARRAFLQVHPSNAPALALYRSMGFGPHHDYRYWEAPRGQGGG
jgi:ribosomal protein S18 acetylase RimI-like enzyme